MYIKIVRLIRLVASKPYLAKAFLYSIFFDGPRTTFQRVANKLNGFQQNFRNYKFALSQPTVPFPPGFLTAFLVSEIKIKNSAFFEIHKYKVNGDGKHAYDGSVEVVNEPKGKILNELIQSENSDFVLIAERSGTSAGLMTKIGCQVAFNKAKADAFYFDSEIFMKNGNLIPHFRTGFSVEYLLSNDCMGNAIVFNRQALLDIGGFSSIYDGYTLLTDMFFRFWQSKRKLLNIPEILQREWEEVKLLGKSPEGQALEVRQKALDNMKISGTVCKSSREDNVFEVEPALTMKPLVSIVVPFKDGGNVLERCFTSIFSLTNYPNFEVIAIDNSSTESQTFELVERLQDEPRFRLLDYKHVFNYSAINNFAVEKAQGEYVILLNSDIEILTADWIQSLLHYATQDGIGAVGGLLFYPDMSIEHAGVIIGLGGVAGHSHRGMPSNLNGYFSRPFCAQEVSAVTAACLMVRKEIYNEVGGLNEKSLGVLYNDVDFCLRLRLVGYRNIYNPRCKAIHYESRTRGHDFTPSKFNRRQLEVEFMLDKYNEMISSGDPFYSPHLCVEREVFELKRGSIYCG